jgi:hypothetical protein
MPVLPQTRERHETAALERDRMGLFPGRGLLPLVKAVDRHQAAAAFEGLAKSGLRFDPLGLGVAIGEADLDVLGPVRHQAPAHQVETALPGLGVETHDGQGIGWCDVPARRKIRRRALGRDREDEFDLADVGGKAGAATHEPKT